MRQKGTFQQAVWLFAFFTVQLVREVSEFGSKFVSLPFRELGWLSHGNLLVGLLERGVFIISCRLLLVMSLVRDNELIKLFTILERWRTMRETDVLHSDPQPRKQAQGTRFVQRLKYSMLVMTMAQYMILEMTKNRRVHGGQVRGNNEIEMLIFIIEIVRKLKALHRWLTKGPERFTVILLTSIPTQFPVVLWKMSGLWLSLRDCRVAWTSN